MNRSIGDRSCRADTRQQPLHGSARRRFSEGVTNGQTVREHLIIVTKKCWHVIVFVVDQLIVFQAFDRQERMPTGVLVQTFENDVQRFFEEWLRGGVQPGIAPSATKYAHIGEVRGRSRTYPTPGLSLISSNQIRKFSSSKKSQPNKPNWPAPRVSFSLLARMTWRIMVCIRSCNRD